MKIERNRSIPMGDGVRLHCDLYLPEDLSAPLPALVCFSPYGKEVQAMALERRPLRTGQAMFDQTIECCEIQPLVDAGYGVVIPSPRGIGNSGGENHGFLSVQDQEDCCAVIAWVARQPWSSGRVGMMGTGFAGRIQPLVAARAPRALGAIMPIDVIDDLYSECYPGGIVSDYPFAYDAMLPVHTAGLDAMDELGEAGLKALLEALRKNPQMQASSYIWRALDSWPPCFHPWTVDCLCHESDGPFWQSRSAKGKAKDIKVPVYAVSFLYEFSRSTLSAINLYCDPALKVPKKLLLAGAGFEKRAPCDQLTTEMLRWYDQWLRDIDTGILDEPPVQLAVMGSESPITDSHWPPADTTLQPHFLSEGGSLQESHGAGAPDELFHQPPAQVPQNRFEIPSICYESAPKAEGVVLSGPLSLTLFAELNATDANWNAFVWLVAPDGSATALSQGFLKASCRTLTDNPENESQSHPQAPCPVTPGAVCCYQLSLAPISCFVPNGYILRLVVKAMDYPLYWPSEKRTFPLLFPSGRVIGPMPGTEFVHYKLYHNAQYPSCLTLPVWKGSLKGGAAQ